ncbi:ABC transporter [Geothermobacter hydrogeniphilus]|uniref:ABC transporter n=1 Tax=Geothermobacter hydrogeniphilus TaxID=1969733 RepID=A0A2K2H8S4_9BACT|nr:ABC transporter ATP-binding protein [Geothermobacter hydrogeniphilus]PNU19633.1 ABC transporter [Geothermobacter hydrogeniphilus]
MNAFELQHICRAIPGDEGPQSLLNDVTVCFEKGLLHALVGPSGGGKTSLLRLLNRLDAPDAGTVSYAGRDLGCWEPRRLRRTVAFVPQQPHIFPGTARDNLLFGLRFHPDIVPTDQQRLSELCALSQFPPDLLSKPAEKLSIGQQQRLVLARALCLEPEVLLLDEPGSALDRPTAEALGRSLRHLCRRSVTIILVSHDLEWVRNHADQVLFMEAGELKLQCPAAAFFNRGVEDRIGRFIAGQKEALHHDG